LGETVPLSASVSGATDTAVTWTVAGIPGGNTTVGTISPSGVFTAPQLLPVPSSPIQITLAPGSAALAIGQRETFSAEISNAPSPDAVWEVNGIPGGNAVVGQICAVGSNPCEPVTAPVASVDYLAPAGVPSPDPLQLQATSVSNPAQSASASVTILAHVVVSISPPSATLAPGQQQAFAAAVAGTTDQQVTWNLSGTGCTGAAAPCGTIDATGLYTTPAAVPSPNTLIVMATSSEDTSRSRATPQTPDAPLSDDDRTAIRTLYPGVPGGVYSGSISGRILPANPLALSGEPAGTTGIFPAHVVAVNAATGAVVAGAVSGWSCSYPGPPVFDGTYNVESLPVGANQAYWLYAQPFDGPVETGDILEQTTLCRNTLTDPGWPVQFACTAPQPLSNFSTAILSGP
jgi:hypothetical protein